MAVGGHSSGPFEWAALGGHGSCSFEWVAVGGVTGGGVGDVAGGGMGGCPVCRLLAAAAAADEVAVVEGAVVVAQLRLPPVELPQPEPGWAVVVAAVVLGRV